MNRLHMGMGSYSTLMLFEFNFTFVQINKKRTRIKAVRDNTDLAPMASQSPLLQLKKIPSNYYLGWSSNFRFCYQKAIQHLTDDILKDKDRAVRDTTASAVSQTLLMVNQ